MAPEPVSEQKHLIRLVSRNTARSAGTSSPAIGAVQRLSVQVAAEPLGPAAQDWDYQPARLCRGLSQLRCPSNHLCLLRRIELSKASNECV